MKKLLQTLLLSMIIVCSLTVVGQDFSTNKKIKQSNQVLLAFRKGNMQIGIEGLNFGFSNGRVIAGLGARYGYFVTNNGLLFINGEYSTWGEGYYSTKVGLNYRQYFNTKRVNPYVQLGVNTGWNKVYESPVTNFYEVSMGGGVTFQVGKFGFDLGMQINIWDKVNMSPRIGVSYSF